MIARWQIVGVKRVVEPKQERRDDQPEVAGHAASLRQLAVKRRTPALATRIDKDEPTGGLQQVAVDPTPAEQDGHRENPDITHVGPRMGWVQATLLTRTQPP